MNGPITITVQAKHYTIAVLYYIILYLYYTVIIYLVLAPTSTYPVKTRVNEWSKVRQEYCTIAGWITSH